jgi:hypothetical protein
LRTSRQSQAGDTTRPISSVRDRDRSSVRLRDLPRNEQADSATLWFGREKRDKQVFDRRQAGSFIQDLHCDRVVRAYEDRATRLGAGIGGVAQQDGLDSVEMALTITCRPGLSLFMAQHGLVVLLTIFQ